MNHLRRVSPIKSMSLERLLTWSLLAFLAGSLGGCTRDPRVRKQKYLDKGNAYADKGKYNEAEIEFENAIQIDPKFEPAHYQLALCYLKQGVLQRAFSELTQAVQLAPADLEAQLELANLLLAARKPADARDHAATVLKNNPGNAQALDIISSADAEQGDLAKAIDEAQKAIQMDVKRSASYVNLALLQERNNDAVDAERNLKKGLALDPKAVPAIAALGQFYEAQKRWPEAEQQFQSAIALEPNNPGLRTTLARLYLLEGRKDLAEKSLQEAKNSLGLKDNPAGYRLLADYYLSQGDLDKASSEFASLYAAHPTDLLVARPYAGILILQNRLDDATKVDDAILRNFPSDYEAQVLHGEILSDQGKPNEAIPILEGAVKSAPNNPAGHYYLGLAYAAASNFGQAQYHWLEAERLAPNMPEPERAIAAYAARSGNTALLLDSSEQLIKLEPRSPEGYLYHASAIYAKGDSAGAEQDLKKAIEIAPQNPVVYERMGDLRASQKQFAEAAKYYNQALSLAPTSNSALTGLVNLDLAQKQPAQALRLVQDQIARVPGNSGLYFLLGQVELRNQDSAKAEEALQKAVELDKNNVAAFAVLAQVQVARGSVDEAIANYQHAIDVNPRALQLYVAEAVLFESRGDWQKAQDLYQKALQIQPDYPVAANNLAYLMLEHGGNINVALSLAQTARRGLPNAPSTADTLGWAYYRQGVYNAAIDMLQQAEKAEPTDPNYHYHLGMAYEKSNDYAQAKKQLEYTLQISPNYVHADDIRKVLSGSPVSN
ncbi:MAG: tetratricopeptide repeat protein [Candidatus Acidiferrales bacterium]